MTHSPPDRPPKVFLLAQPSISRRGEAPDLSPLGEFGEVTILMTADLNPLFAPAKSATAVERKLEDFDPDYDFLTAAGGATLAALVIGVVLGQMDIEEFTWLSYQRGTDGTGRRVNAGGYYRPVQLSLGQLDLGLGNDENLSNNDEEDDDDDDGR
jgi:hypothetical protein